MRRGRAVPATALLALVACTADAPPARRDETRTAACPVRTVARECVAPLSGLADTTYRGDNGRTGAWGAAVARRPRVVDEAPGAHPSAGAAGAVHFTAGADLRAAPGGGGPGWSASLGQHLSPVAVTGDVVYAGGQPPAFGGQPPRPGRLHALGATDGRWLWEVETDGAPTAPAVTGDLVHTVTRNGELLAVTRGGEVRLRVALREPVEAPVAVADGVVVVLLRSGTTVAVGAADGAERWRRQGAAEATRPPVATGGEVYVTSGTTLRSYDLASGRPRWSVPTRARLGLPLTVDARHVYAPAGAGIVAYDRRDGRVRWRAAPASTCPAGSAVPFGCGLGPSDVVAAPAVAAHDTVLVAYTVSGVAGYDARTGRRRWRVPVAVGARDAVVTPTARGLWVGSDGQARLLAWPR